MAEKVAPTERELDILKVLWDRGEATVRDVYEELRQRLPIVQNTVQAFLRTMLVMTSSGMGMRPSSLPSGEMT